MDGSTLTMLACIAGSEEMDNQTDRLITQLIASSKGSRQGGGTTLLAQATRLLHCIQCGRKRAAPLLCRSIATPLQTVQLICVEL